MTPYEFQGPVTNTGKFVTDFLINPLGIPREQTLEQLESFLKRLASDEGFAILQRRLFLACMCLVAGLGSALLSGLGIRTHVLGPCLSAIALLFGYWYLHKTPWSVWMGIKFCETSIFRAQFSPSLLRQWKADAPSTETTSTNMLAHKQVLGLERFQIYQLIAWLAAWVGCVFIVSKVGPKTQIPPLQDLALLGLASYLTVRVGMVLVQMLQLTGAVFGGLAVGAALVFFESFWTVQGGGQGANVAGLFVATIGLGVIWSLSLMPNSSFDMYYVTIPRGGQSRYHFRTPDLSAFSKLLNPMLFTIHAPSSTVIVLRRNRNGTYSFQDPQQPISPLQYVYDVFDLSETQALMGAYNLVQEQKSDSLQVIVEYGCQPRTPSSEEMLQDLDGEAVKRFTEVFFHGMGLAATVGPWVGRAAQLFRSHPLYQTLIQIRFQAKQLSDIAGTVRPEHLRSTDREKLLRLRHSFTDLGSQVEKLRDTEPTDAARSLQQHFEEIIDEEFKGIEKSYKLLVSMLSLRITRIKVSDLDRVTTEIEAARAAFQERLDKAHWSITEQEKARNEFASSHLPGDMTLAEVQESLSSLDPSSAFAQPDKSLSVGALPPSLLIEDEGGAISARRPNVTRVEVELKLLTVEKLWKVFVDKPTKSVTLAQPGCKVALILRRDEESSIPAHLHGDASEQSGVTEVKVGVKLETVEMLRKMFLEEPPSPLELSAAGSEVALRFTRAETIPGEFHILTEL